MEEIYKEYSKNICRNLQEDIRNIHKHLWSKMIRNSETQTQWGTRRRQRLCFWSFYIIDIYGYSLYIPYIFHISFLKMLHRFSLVCFLIYGVKSSFGHEQMMSVGQISHVSVPKLSFWGNFMMVLHGFASRSPKNTVLRQNNNNIRPTKIKKDTQT